MAEGLQHDQQRHHEGVHPGDGEGEAEHRVGHRTGGDQHDDTGRDEVLRRAAALREAGVHEELEDRQQAAEDGEGNPLSGSGKVVEGQTDETGLFWFFEPNNWEVMIKVLDGCAVNGYFWVFGASTTDVAFTIVVTDTKTGLVKTFVNPAGTAADAITDTEALQVCEP